MKANDGKSNMFDHMNTKNLSASEMAAEKRIKKRKLNDVSNTTVDTSI